MFTATPRTIKSTVVVVIYVVRLRIVSVTSGDGELVVERKDIREWSNRQDAGLWSRRFKVRSLAPELVRLIFDMRIVGRG